MRGVTIVGYILELKSVMTAQGPVPFFQISTGQCNPRLVVSVNVKIKTFARFKGTLSVTNTSLCILAKCYVKY